MSEGKPRNWRKSRYSAGHDSGNCVEAASGSGVHVRDSRDPGPVLTVSAGAWTAFTAAVRRG